MSKHTKGPWRVKELSTGTIFIETDLKDYPVICQVMGEVSPERVAITNLIAAAPDLKRQNIEYREQIETMRRALEWFITEIELGDGRPITQQTINEARQAIAAAKGEAT